MADAGGVVGLRQSPLGWGSVATMEPPNRSELDNFAVVAALQRIGYVAASACWAGTTAATST